MVSRYFVGVGLLFSVGVAYGNWLQVTYDGSTPQSPENVVAAGVPITYSFHNALVEDGIYDESPNIGTGIQISVDGEVVTPASGIFVANDNDNDGAFECNADPFFPNAWKCDDLTPISNGQEYSFTWTPPAVGTYVVDFLGFCQEQPVPNPPRLCEVNGNEGGSGTVAYVTTIVDTDTDGDGVFNGNDPDDDNDGIADDLDEQPLFPSNGCTGGGFDNATLDKDVVSDLTCAARVSIQVEGTTEVWGSGSVSPPGHLRLIAPAVRFEDGFTVQEGALLSVTSENPCPGCGGYQIGDEGPAGGIVFYVTDGGYHGLEAATEDLGIADWCQLGLDVEGVVNITDVNVPDPNTGEFNTAAIIERCGISYAAHVAANYVWPNGQLGGFLPNKEELRLMYQHLDAAGSGNFQTTVYWSSSEFNELLAWGQGFGDFAGAQFYDLKYMMMSVRAVRTF